MEVQYHQWIEQNVTRDGYGQCAEVTEAMAKEFPELTRVRGHYFCAIWGERAHWWLTTTDGKIVDPTAAQFPTKGHGHYAELDASLPEPTGMCPNCGGECFDGGTCCCERCHNEYAAYCMNPF